MRRTHPTQLDHLLIKVVRWPLRRVSVVGASMEPTFAPGDRLLVDRWAPIRVGSVVAVADPRQPERMLIKRVRALGPDGIDVRGDNPAASTDSRTFGPVSASDIAGRVVYRYGPPTTAGRVR